MGDEEKIRIFLEKIRDNSILKELTDYECFQELNLTKNKRTLMEFIIRSNERGRFPKVHHISKELPLVDVSCHYRQLNSLNLLVGVTIPDINGAFDFQHGSMRRWPAELDYATWGDIQNYRSIKGESKSWRQKNEFSIAKAYSRYYIAPISKNGKPVFGIAFSFLGYAKADTQVVKQLL